MDRRDLILLCGLFGCSLVAGSDLVSFQPRDGLLVLRNGYVLSGRIMPLGESYLVSMGDGGEARVPRIEVEFDCRDLDEAYRMKRDTLDSDEPKSHLKLAEWCLRHGLLARAADQLLVVRLQDSKHPQLAVFERRLEARAQLQSPPPTTATPPATRTAATQAAPSIEPFLIQQFTTTIQPILLNRCATYACHGGGATPYRLVRPSMGQVATSRLTQRNLQATLVYVDRDEPSRSRLLQMAQQSHGRVVTAAFNEKTGNQLELLAVWVRRLGMSFAPPATPSSAAAADAQAPMAARQEAWVPPGGAEPPSGRESPPAEFRPATVNVKPLDARSNTPPSPTDPLDPELFNRQFHPPSPNSPAQRP